MTTNRPGLIVCSRHFSEADHKGECIGCGQSRMLTVNNVCFQCDREATVRYEWTEKLHEWNKLSEAAK